MRCGEDGEAQHGFNLGAGYGGCFLFGPRVQLESKRMCNISLADSITRRTNAIPYSISQALLDAGGTSGEVGQGLVIVVRQP